MPITTSLLKHPNHTNNMTKEKAPASEQKAEKPSWLVIKPAEVEKIVLDLHNQGIAPAKIGVILRDKHGIPKTKLVGRKVKAIIEGNKSAFPTEISQVQTRIKNLERHSAQHKHDYTAKRAHMKKQWIVNKLTKLEN